MATSKPFGVAAMENQSIAASDKFESIKIFGLRVKMDALLIDGAISAVENCIFYECCIENAVGALILAKKVDLSKILKTSHAFCKNCCELYTPCHVGEWIDKNPELYDSEIAVYRELLLMCPDNINIDVVPYSESEVNTFGHVSEVTDEEKLRQLYTVCLG